MLLLVASTSFLKLSKPTISSIYIHSNEKERYQHENTPAISVCNRECDDVMRLIRPMSNYNDRKKNCRNKIVAALLSYI